MKPCHTSLQAEPFLAPFYYSAYTISQKGKDKRVAKSRNVQDQPRLTRGLGGWVAILFAAFSRVMKGFKDAFHLFTLVQCYFLDCENSRLSSLLPARDVPAARRDGCFWTLISFLLETNRGCSELVNLGITSSILTIRIFRLLFTEFSQILQSFECTQHVSATTHIACSRRSNSRGREKNSQRIKKEGRLEGERGREGRKEEGGREFPCSPPPPSFSRCTI